MKNRLYAGKMSNIFKKGSCGNHAGSVGYSLARNYFSVAILFSAGGNKKLHQVKVKPEKLSLNI